MIMIFINLSILFVEARDEKAKQKLNNDVLFTSQLDIEK
jgi:hypothetical protein